MGTSARESVSMWFVVSLHDAYSMQWAHREPTRSQDNIAYSFATTERMHAVCDAPDHSMFAAVLQAREASKTYLQTSLCRVRLLRLASRLTTCLSSGLATSLACSPVRCARATPDSVMQSYPCLQPLQRCGSKIGIVVREVRDSAIR